jgi:hypothetical protein
MPCALAETAIKEMAASIAPKIRLDMIFISLCSCVVWNLTRGVLNPAEYTPTRLMNDEAV